MWSGLHLVWPVLDPKESHRSGRSVDRHGNGLGAPERKLGPDPFCHQACTATPNPAAAQVGRACSWFLPKARRLVVSLHSGLHVPYSLPPRRQGTPGPAQGPPQEKGESSPKLPTPTLSRKTPVI